MFIVFILSSCSKPKTVLICGDHICINKDEAQQYFEENLSIEVKIIDRKLNKDDDLVELNLRENTLGNKKISISSKNSTKNPIKKLSKKEIIKIKADIQKKNKKKVAKKLVKKKNKINIQKNTQKIKLKSNEKIITNKNMNKKRKDIVDICTILEKCSIDEISKYLIKQGKNKKFPNITTRE
jgi:hypothetical protein